MSEQITLSGAPFTHAEAISIIHCEIYDKQLQEPQTADIGVVVGVLDMNDEVEVIVKFLSSVRQFTKSELIEQFSIEC